MSLIQRAESVEQTTRYKVPGTKYKVPGTTHEEPAIKLSSEKNEKKKKFMRPEQGGTFKRAAQLEKTDEDLSEQRGC